jgi:predicted nucleic acid-binding protein
MTEPIFVDTNVLVYAVDAGAGVKHAAARDWMTVLWERQTGRISVQVLQEFYVTVTRKLRPGMSPAEAQREVRALMPWAPSEINSLILERAWFIESRYTLSWWDAQIVASAQTLGCRTLLTADLQHGQQFDDLTVVNPFRVEPPAR